MIHRMKKVNTLLSIIAATILTSCNDGDIVYKDIDFDKVTNVSRCSNPGAEKIFHKIQKDEALILVIDADNLMRDESVPTVSAEIDGTSTSLEYRKYNDPVSAASICDAPAPAFPTVIQSIPASAGGTIIINRNIAMKNNNEETNSTVSLTYQYAFYMRNISFKDGDTNIKYDNMLFGTNNYDSRTLTFKFTNNDGSLKELNQCNEQFITLSDKEALLVNLKLEDFPTDATSTAKLINLTAERQATFRQYKRTGINIRQVCDNNGDIPGTSEGNINNLVELWTSQDGTISITSRWTNPVEGEPKLVHTVNLENTVFTKDQYKNQYFTKTKIILGEFTIQ